MPKKILVLAAFAAASLVVLHGAAASGPTGVTCGSTISAPGHYYLTGDCTGSGITITASNVRLKLDGHTMTGSGSCCGLFASAVSRLHIEGPGTITRYDIGIQFGFGAGVNDSHVEKVTVSDNAQYGMAIQYSHHDEFNADVATGNGDIGFVENFDSSDIHFDNDIASTNGNNGISLAGPGSATATNVDNSTADGNGRNGIDIGPAASGNHIDGNTANNNGVNGIFAVSGATGNHIDGNTALGNALYDLEDLNPGCDGNNWDGNHFATANQSCIY